MKQANNTSPNEVADASLADDLVRGIKAIAGFIGEDPRRTYYLCERGYIPVGKVGVTWTGSKRVLRAHYAKITGGAA